MRCAFQLSGFITALFIGFGLAQADAGDLPPIKMPERSGVYTIDLAGAPDSLVIRWLVRDQKGVLILCGNFANKGHSYGSGMRGLLASMEVLLDGKRIHRNIRFFTKHQSPDSLVGGEAACVSTGVKTPRGKGHKVKMKMGRNTIRG